MDYISGEQYAAATASSAYTTANNLEKQVKELIAIVNNLKIEIDVIKNRLNNLDTSKEPRQYDYYEDDTWFHPFGD